MYNESCSEDEFVALFEKHKSATVVAEILGVPLRSVFSRRKRIEKRNNISLNSGLPILNPQDGFEIQLEVLNGTIMVGSDAHYWPGIISTAHRAFVHLTKKLKPDAIILNGDVFDGASVSRHPRSRWEARPNVKQELGAVTERLREIEKAAKGARLIRTRGNHDDRYESRLSMNSPEYEGVGGTTLKEHLPRWLESLAVRVNEDELQILHNDHNGIHAAYNNTLKGGMSVCTGHLHALQVTAWSDLRGTRWGIDSGTLADTHGEQFGYMGARRRNWRSGFAVLTFHEGKLLYPELVYVIDENRVCFRGQVIEV